MGVVMSIVEGGREGGDRILACGDYCNENPIGKHCESYSFFKWLLMLIWYEYSFFLWSAIGCSTSVSWYLLAQS